MRVKCEKRLASDVSVSHYSCSAGAKYDRITVVIETATTNRVKFNSRALVVVMLMAQREGVWNLIERFQFESLYRENKNDKCNFTTQRKNSH